MLIHKECKEDEIFVGNTRADSNLIDLLNKVSFRKGDQAYDIHGGKIETEYMRPLFIAKKDYDKYNSIMCAGSK